MNDETSADQTDLSTSPPLPPYVPPPPLALPNFTVHEAQERLNLNHQVTERESCSKENKQNEKSPPADGCNVVQGESNICKRTSYQRGRSTLAAFPWQFIAK